MKKKAKTIVTKATKLDNAEYKRFQTAKIKIASIMQSNIPAIEKKKALYKLKRHIRKNQSKLIARMDKLQKILEPNGLYIGIDLLASRISANFKRLLFMLSRAISSLGLYNKNK